MKFTYVAFLAGLACLSAATQTEARFARRQVPQEHSHEALLTAMRGILPFNTESIRKTGKLPDVVIALLGNKVADTQAPAGDGTCLQQDMADTAIMLANGDKTKIATALKFRALERNTPGVGTASPLCAKEPINAILKGLTQHQDAASANADAVNKAVELTLAQKLGSIGVDPLQVLETATFAAGDKSDNTGKGKTCDDANDKAGCIFTQKLNTPIATEAELKAAGAKGDTGAAASGTATAAAASQTDAASADSTSVAASSADASATATDSADASNATDAAVNADATATDSADASDATDAAVDADATATDSADAADATDAAADADATATDSADASDATDAAVDAAATGTEDASVATETASADADSTATDSADDAAATDASTASDDKEDKEDKEDKKDKKDTEDKKDNDSTNDDVKDIIKTLKSKLKELEKLVK